MEIEPFEIQFFEVLLDVFAEQKLLALGTPQELEENFVADIVVSHIVGWIFHNVDEYRVSLVVHVEASAKFLKSELNDGNECADNSQRRSEKGRGNLDDCAEYVVHVLIRS